ncbi:MAG: thiamine-monophosphate kinase [Calditrichaeota bacterium]|nr:thiamine-monophosphate kinase [Calditrichota bacterium]
MFARKSLSEALVIELLTKNCLRALNQINGLHECDAELVDLGDGHDELLAVTTDSIAEEIAAGLYSDPWQMGWMTAMVNFSDLAAVGAKPFGLLTAVTLPSDVDGEFVERLGLGIASACQFCGAFVLGGDTNFGKSMLLSATAVGTVPREGYLTRKGCALGDKVFLSAPAGAGNAYAFVRLQPCDADTSFFLPSAKIREGIVLRDFAHCCMDTSDGVLATLDTVTRLNHYGVMIREDWERILHPTAMKLCQQYHIPPWAALAGIHGEYELCFTVSAKRERTFLAHAETIGWRPILLGEMVEEAGIFFERGTERLALDLDSLRSLSGELFGNPADYIRALTDYVRAMESRWHHV